MTTFIVFLVALFAFMLIGLPLAFVLIICAIFMMLSLNQSDVMVIAQNMVSGTNSFALMAIPFFMLAGEIMDRGGLSLRIVKFAKLIVGRIRGGLGYTAILATIVFSGLSGSAVADAAALGAILIPLMIKSGYKKSRSVAFIAAGAIVAPMIPPSIPMIVMGTSTGLSITKLFMSGLVPGIIVCLGLMVAWFFVVRADNYDDRETFTWKEAKAIMLDSFPALLMPIFIVGGIRFGIFTPTEAGAFAVVYALIICTFYYKEFSFKDIGSVLVSSAASTATIMFIVAGATAASIYFTLAQIPAAMANLLGGLIEHPTLLMLLINIFLLCMGMIMDCTPNILIFAPVLFPIIRKAGIDPYYFACLMNFNLCIGLITPPVGVVLYVAMDASKDGEKLSVGPVVKHLLPFLVVEFGLLFLMIFVPQLITVPLKWLT